MKLAERVLNLKPSATLSISTLTQELRAQGKDILSLSIGEPDFDTPEDICQAAIKAINDRITRYTPVPGLPEARAAVVHYFKHFYKVSAKNENVILSNGGKHSLFNALLSIIDPGDQVIIPAPYWVSYPPMVELMGGKPTIIPTLASKNFKITCEDLEQNVTPKTKAIILNSPSNPTGVVYTKEELDRLAQWAVDHKIFIISDEIYDRLVYSGIEPVSLSPWWAKHPENFIICGGVAKSFAMTGWRVGYLLAHKDIVNSISKLQGQSTSNICSIAQMAAVAALTGDYSSIETMRNTFEKRRDLAYEIISTWDNVLCPKPEGAFYIFPSIQEYYNKKHPDSASFCAALLDATGVALVPGVAFGNDNCVRISYAVADDVLEEALTRVGKFLKK